MVLLAVGLYIMGYIAIVAEFFIPAGGFVGLAGVGSIIGGIILVYRNYGNRLGLVFLVAALIFTPVLMVLYFKYFPRSFMGKRLILFKDQKKEQGFIAHTISVYEKLEGKEGVSLTPLRPAGTVLIDARRYSVVTSGEFIETGRKIKVLSVEGGRMIVGKLNMEEGK